MPEQPKVFRVIKNGLKNTSKEVIPNAAWIQVGDKVMWKGNLHSTDLFIIEKYPR